MAVLQYSATEHFKKSELTPLDSLPGVYFFYDFSPIKVVPSCIYIILLSIYLESFIIILVQQLLLLKSFHVVDCCYLNQYQMKLFCWILESSLGTCTVNKYNRSAWGENVVKK